jgi:hypothetical protein
MKREMPNFHDREAARLRGLAFTAITPFLKARFLEMAEQQERLAEELRQFQVEREPTAPDN